MKLKLNYKLSNLQILYIILLSLFNASAYSQATSSLSNDQVACIEDNFTMTVGEDGFLFSDFNFKEDFYDIDDASNFYLKTLTDILATKEIKLIKVVPIKKSITEYEHLSPTNSHHLSFSLDESINNYLEHIEQLKELGLSAPNIFQLYTGEGNFFIDYDAHWSILGSRLSALAVSETIKSKSNYESLAKTNYKTYVKGDTVFFGATKALFEKCSAKIDPFKSKNLRTFIAPDSESTLENQLFSETYYPVVVVGTSFSFRPFNFVGFLSQSLSLPVLSWAQPNAKLEASLLSFFVSETYLETPPKFLVWESANYSFLDAARQLRQIVPAATGGCTEGIALYDSTLKIDTSSFSTIYPLFEDLENITANEHFLEISYIEHSAKSNIDYIRIYSNYTDADEDVKLLDHSFFDDQHKIFYLFSHLNHDLDTVSIALPKDIDITLQARICPLTY